MNSLRRLMCVLALFGGEACAGSGVWTSNGPEGGLLYDVVAHPTQPSTLYALARSGVFRSDDNGFSWQRLSGSPQLYVFPTSSLIIDADRPNDMYVHTPQRAVYRSSDGGATWAKTGWIPSLDWFTGRLLDAPGEVGVLYMNTRSFAAGATPVSALLRSTNFGETFTPFGDGLPIGKGMMSMAIQAGSPNVMLLGTTQISIGSGMPNPPCIYRSIDGGANWTGVFVETTTTPNTGLSGQTSGLSFADPTRVYAEVNARMRRSDDGGLTFSAVQTTPSSMTTPTGSSFSSVFATAVAPLTVWAHGPTGLRRSTDGGITFTDITTGLSPNPSYLPIVPPLTPVQPSILRMAASGDYQVGVAGSLWVAAEGAGLLRSIDDGNNWQTAHSGLNSVNIRTIAVHPGQHVSNHPPGQPAQRLFAGLADLSTGSTAMYASTNGGTSWSVLNFGLKATQIRDIVIDPATTGGVEPDGQPSNPPVGPAPSPGVTRMYAVGLPSVTPSSYRNGGIYRSTNGGSTWNVIDAGLPTRQFNGIGEPPTTINVADVSLVRQLTFDPRSCTPPTFPLACTTPLQRLWTTTSGQTVNTTVPSSSLDPHCGAGSQLSTLTHRIVRSLNGGDSWAASDTGWPVSERVFCVVGGVTHSVGYSMLPVDIVVSPNDPNVLYSGSFIGYTDSPVGHALPDIPTGVFKSVNGGDTWAQVSNGLPPRVGFTQARRDVLSLAMHPNNDQVLWASVIEGATAGTSAIYKTTDGAATWFLSASGLPTSADIRAIVVDPGAPDILYAAGAGNESDPGSVYKSEDGGTTWRSISVGLPADSALSLALDPFNANVLHAGLLSGAWSLTQVPDNDGDGVPDGTENNAPNGGDGNGDALPDAAQKDVGSTVIIFRRAPDGAGGFFTSDVDSAASTPSLPGGCQQAVDVQVVSASQYGRDYVNGGPHFFKYPRDLARFEVLDCGRALVDLTFHNAAFSTEYGWSFRYYGPVTPGDEDSFGWYDIGARVQRVVGSSNKWRAALDANQFGSYRPVADRVLFVGGPACYDDRLFRNSMETSPDAGPPSCDH